jgi:hypothetical protein
VLYEGVGVAYQYMQDVHIAIGAKRMKSIHLNHMYIALIALGHLITRKVTILLCNVSQVAC